MARHSKFKLLIGDLAKNPDPKVVMTAQGIIEKTSLLNLEKAKLENTNAENQLSDLIEKVKIQNIATAYPDYATSLGWDHPLVSINLETLKKGTVINPKSSL